MKHLTIGILLCLMSYQMLQLHSKVIPIHPYQFTSEQKHHPLQAAAKKVGIPTPDTRIVKAVEISSRQTGIKDYFILSLMYTESTFNPRAVSSKGYYGLMQIPFKIFDYDANTRIGTDLFVEKLIYSNGDYRKALVMYKGWSLGESEGWKQADKVLKLARKIKEAV